MKLLVAGRDGYIGSAMTSVLIRAGYVVSGLDTYYYKDSLTKSLAKGIRALPKGLQDIKTKGDYQVQELTAIAKDTTQGWVVKYKYTEDGKSDPRSYRVSFSTLLEEVSAYCPTWNARPGTRTPWSLSALGAGHGTVAGSALCPLETLKAASRCSGIGLCSSVAQPRSAIQGARW